MNVFWSKSKQLANNDCRKAMQYLDQDTIPAINTRSLYCMSS